VKLMALSPVPVRFYKSATGSEPVREWLGSFDKEDRRVLGIDLAKVQFGWPVGMPICRPLKGGLWEVRSSLPSKREARLLFGFHEGTLVVLHGFIKKSQATPKSALLLAEQRLKAVTG
jgi:phage-related protein